MDSLTLTKRFLVTLASIGLLLPTLALAAGGAQQEVKTAEQHATFASKAKDADTTHLHLHHVINCLVGPGGDGFDAKAGNPCKGQGDGALHTVKSKDELQTLEQALALAKLGAQISSYKPAHYTAMAVRELLKEAKRGK
jgi:hypothetical protein